jgi:integrase
MPSLKLTKAVIDGLPTPSRDVFYWDAKLPGFGVKVSPSGHRSYVIQYRNNRNRSKRLTLSKPSLMSLETVRDEARRKLQQVRDGIDPALVRRERIEEPVVGELLDRWVRDCLEKAEITQTDRSRSRYEVAQLRELIGKLPISQVTRDHLRGWHAEPEQSSRPVAANGVIRRFKWVLEWHEIHAPLGKYAPSLIGLFKRFPFYKDIKRERTLDGSEYQRIAGAIQHHRKVGDLNDKQMTLIELLMVSGIRMREGRLLRYDHGGRNDTNYIDPDRKEIVLQRHKTWQKVGTKYVPITTEIRSVLDHAARYRVIGNPHVFPADKFKAKRGPIAYPDTTWNTILDTAGFPPKAKGAKRRDVIPHDLRRSLISYGIEQAGIPLESMAKTIGHADPKTTRDHYHRVSAAKQRANMEATTAMLAKVFAGTK